MSKPKPDRLTWKRGWKIFAVCWAATFLAVWVLRQVLIPKDELACYARVGMFQKAVDRWNKAHPEARMDRDVEEEALVGMGMKSQTYDREKHWYFVGKTPWGPRVKCNKHEDNPTVLKLTGVTLLALLAFVVYCSTKKIVLFDPA